MTAPLPTGCSDTQVTGPWGPSFIYSATPIETTFFFFSQIGAGCRDTQIIIVFAPWWGRLLSLETQLVSQNE